MIAEILEGGHSTSVIRSADRALLALDAAARCKASARAREHLAAAREELVILIFELGRAQAEIDRLRALTGDL